MPDASTDASTRLNYTGRGLTGPALSGSRASPPKAGVSSAKAADLDALGKPGGCPLRMNWQLKAVLPIAAVLLNGLLLFILATVSMQMPQRNTVIAVAAAGAFVICAVLLVVLGTMIQRPMIELQQKIARVREGDLKVSVSFAHRNDEIGDLGRNFNEMVRQLRDSREEIQRLHRTQMSRAEHLATLGELAAGLAHEIRNPLAGIAGVMEVIGRDLPDSSPARSVLKEVRQEVQHINRIVTDLLECARPKSPEFRLSDLNATADHAVVFARQQALSRAIKIEFERDDSLPGIEHDTGQIHQVLLNLLLNAIQAIDGTGTIRLTITANGDFATLAISDTGRGIAPENLSNIFRPFFTTKGQGTGLGLSLARRIIEDHGGRIEVTSTVGQGTTFSITLPVARPYAGESRTMGVGAE
jgi:signal transduction histidine kinase